MNRESFVVAIGLGLILANLVMLAGLGRAQGQESKPTGQPPEAQPERAAPKVAEPRSLILTAKLVLMADPRLFHYEIEVEMKGDEAVLSGKVASKRDKLAALSAVQKLPGITKVVDRLEVVKDLNRTLARKRDELVTHSVRERFAKSKTLQAAGFEVRTENGVVMLSGKTRFQVILLEAAEAVREVPGVRAVRTVDVHLEGGE